MKARIPDLAWPFVEIEIEAEWNLVLALLPSWLWAWLWPWRAGDREDVPPSLVAPIVAEPVSLPIHSFGFNLALDAARRKHGGRRSGIRPITRSLPSDDASVARTLGVTRVLRYREPPAPGVRNNWLVEVNDQPPALLSLSPGDKASRLRIAFEPTLARSYPLRKQLARRLRALRVSLPWRWVHRTSALDLEDPEQPWEEQADACDLLLEAFEAIETASKGGWLRPLDAQRARWSVAAMAALARSRAERDWLDDEEVHEALGAIGEMFADLDRAWPPGGAAQPEDPGASISVPSEATPEGESARPGMSFDRPAKVERGRLILVGERGHRLTLDGVVAELLDELRARASEPTWTLGLLAADRLGGTSLAGTATPGLPWPTTAFFVKGSGQDWLVSRRLLAWGPWRVERSEGDLHFVQIHDADALEYTANRQIEAAASWLQGLFLPTDPRLPERVAEYDPDTRSILLRVTDTPPSSLDLAHVVAWARRHASGPEAVERVVAPIQHPVLARLWLPFLWLREVQVWTVEDGAWTRIDEGYQPGWGRPGWVERVGGDG